MRPDGMHEPGKKKCYLCGFVYPSEKFKDNGTDRRDGREWGCIRCHEEPEWWKVEQVRLNLFWDQLSETPYRAAVTHSHYEAAMSNYVALGCSIPAWLLAHGVPPIVVAAASRRVGERTTTPIDVYDLPGEYRVSIEDLPPSVRQWFK